jgi:RNA polymerase sigma factor (sigma-70 family)
MTTHINFDDFNAVAKQHRDLVRMKVRQFARVNPLYVRRLGAQDLFQEALIALWIATKTYNGRLPFHVYAAVLIQRRLFRCIRFRHYLQREKTIAEYPEFAMIRYDDPTRPVTTSDLFDHVLKVAKRILTRKQYICLTAYRRFTSRYEVKKRKQIAKRLHCSVDTISVHYYQAIRRLRLAFNVSKDNNPGYG